MLPDRVSNPVRKIIINYFLLSGALGLKVEVHFVFLVRVQSLELTD